MQQKYASKLKKKKLVQENNVFRNLYYNICIDLITVYYVILLNNWKRVGGKYNTYYSNFFSKENLVYFLFWNI